MNDPLLNASEAELLAQLPTSVSAGIKTLSATMDWDAVGANLATAPGNNLAIKSGSPWTGNLWQAVKAEFRSFLCTESPEYATLRAEWGTLSQKSSTLAVAALSGAIGAHLGVASGVLAPLVIWSIVASLKIGRGALCQLLLQQTIGLPAAAIEPDGTQVTSASPHIGSPAADLTSDS